MGGRKSTSRARIEQFIEAENDTLLNILKLYVMRGGLATQHTATEVAEDLMNEVVIEAGGRIYLTKDALTRPEHLRAMEPRLARFAEIRRKLDPEGALRSVQSVRLLGDLA